MVGGPHHRGPSGEWMSKGTRDINLWDGFMISINYLDNAREPLERVSLKELLWSASTCVTADRQKWGWRSIIPNPLKVIQFIRITKFHQKANNLLEFCKNIASEERKRKWIPGYGRDGTLLNPRWLISFGGPSQFPLRLNWNRTVMTQFSWFEYFWTNLIIPCQCADGLFTVCWVIRAICLSGCCFQEEHIPISLNSGATCSENLSRTRWLMMSVKITS